MVKFPPLTSAPALETPLGDSSLHWLAYCLRTVIPDAHHTLVYGSANSDHDPSDIDLAVIVDDGADRFEDMRRIAPLLAQQIIQSGVLATCFPIRSGVFAGQTSQFVKNVRSAGRFL